MKILVIEDSQRHLLSAEKFAKDCGHEVTIVTTYDEAEKALCGDDRFGRKEAKKNFDVVLSDLFLPASVSGLGNPSEFRNTSQPYGLSLAFLALRTGVKAVGILTDGSHHGNPMTWALDSLRGYDGKPFIVGEATILFSSNGPGMYDNIERTDPLYGAKDWMEFWLLLLNARSPLQEL